MKTIRLLFSDDMARAIVEGRKTVTRRPIAPQPVISPDVGQHLAPGETLSMLVDEAWQSGFVDVRAPCSPGDLLIGRECFRFEDFAHVDGVWSHGVRYRAGGTGPYRHGGAELMDERMGWRPSIHMPDWVARIRRRVVSVTVERVQDITEEDAVREGFVPREPSPPVLRHHSARDLFFSAWDSIYAAKGLGWDANPWVWRIEFGAENVEGGK